VIVEVIGITSIYAQTATVASDAASVARVTIVASIAAMTIAALVTVALVVAIALQGHVMKPIKNSGLQSGQNTDETRFRAS
jgi:hypothetical protein